MTRLLLTLLIAFVPLAYAVKGDVYSCRTDLVANVKDAEFDVLPQRDFIFSWTDDHTVKYHGKENWFGKAMCKITSDYYPDSEYFECINKKSITIYSRGRFRYSLTYQAFQKDFTLMTQTVTSSDA